MFNFKSRVMFVASLVLAGLFAMPAQALPDLAKDSYVNERLIGAVVGDQIRRKCTGISPRIWAVFREKRKLEIYATKLGYSKKQMTAFIGKKSEKSRVNAVAAAYLIENGVVEGDAESYCKLGRREIAAETFTGSLLRAN